jgi:hypothetical protein
MNWNKLRNTTYLLAGTLLLPALLAGSPETCQPDTSTSESDSWDYPEEASSVIEQIRSHAAEVNRNADTLQSFARSNQVSWHSHAVELAQVRDHVNAMGKLHCQLQVNRNVALPWQQKAIDHVTPKLVNLANLTETAIQVLAESPSTLFATNYTEQVAEMYELTDEINDSLGAFLESAEMRQKLEQLEQNLTGA